MDGMIRDPPHRQEQNKADYAHDAIHQVQDNSVLTRIPGPEIDNAQNVNSRKGAGHEHIQRTEYDVGGELELACGPLLNYKGMTGGQSRAKIWHGSVLIVTKPGQKQPELTLECLRPGGPETHTSGELDGEQKYTVHGLKLYAETDRVFWRFALELPVQGFEARWTYSLSGVHFLPGASTPTSSARTFVVPSVSQSMRIMFHSCNGFSVGTDEDAWSGPALWNDVLRAHDLKPFHVMIGGGDQIYNDGVRVGGPLRRWTDITNPHKRREYAFGETLRAECDKYYFDNYVRWFSMSPFAIANGQIPQVNIWDDHDIIDGFGSYTDHFMKCEVFRGIGRISFKYYCLFQHHIPPPTSPYTTATRQIVGTQKTVNAGADSCQSDESFILQEKQEDPSWIMGARPGPYVHERSRSLYMRMGAHIGFLGVDARTERTRHQVNYEDTYDIIFSRVRSEISSSPEIKHLIVLLGVPIAYPRLAWLETIFTSPIIGPIRFLSRRFGVAGGLFNRFDGQVDLLDDLDDHYTARQHKHERKVLMLRLQSLAEEHNVRITILGGDVHLAAVGRFYSKPKLNIPAEHDHRYMANIISSAITNKPPPKAIANLLSRRNKIHHLDHHTHETLMNLFEKDPGGSQKTGNYNKCTMPSRNYAIITEAPWGETTNGDANGHVSDTGNPSASTVAAGNSRKNDGHSPLHIGEEGAGTKHIAASGLDGGAMPGALDVAIRVEINQHDPEGKTEGYGFSIPLLTACGKP
ncbi:MAG: hypothetical protein Q9163_001192 [Psora crenata]